MKKIFNVCVVSFSLLLGIVTTVAAQGTLTPVWGVNRNDDIYFRTGVTSDAPKGSAWMSIGGKLVNISVGQGDRVWGVNKAGEIFFREGVAANNPTGTGWTKIDGGLANIAVGQDGRVWGVNNTSDIWFREGITPQNPKGTGWTRIEGGLSNIAVGQDGRVWGVNRGGEIWFRDGITPQNPKGTGWTRIEGGLSKITVGQDGRVWGVNRADEIWFREGITPQNPKGTGWTHVDGKLTNISIAQTALHLSAEIAKQIAAGGKIFTHVPDFDGELLRWHENWKLAEPGKGWIKFKARATNDIFVAFSTLPQDIPINSPVAGADYRYVIGGWSNTQSTIRRNSGGAWTKGVNNMDVALTNIKQGGNPNALVTGGAPKDGTQWDDYWFQVDNGIVTWGKGAVVGQNEMQRYVDPAPLKFVQYVLLGGWSSTRVEYKDIEFSKPVPVPLVINLPEGFEPEEGKVKRITVGSRNGELEAWVVGFDEQLYRYDTYSMAANPWVKQEFKDAAGAVMKFEDISCSSDDTMVAIGEHGKALRYDWNNKKWNLIDPGKGSEALDLEFISAGNKDCVWAVDTDDKDIYELTKEGWKVRADGIGIYVAAGLDGTVVALNEKGLPYRYHEGKWFEMGDVKLERIAVGDRHHIIGSTDKDNMLWQWTHPEWKHAEGKQAEDKHAKPAHEKGAEHVYTGPHGRWEPMLGKDNKPATGLDEIAINAAGTIFGADEDGDPYHKGEAGVSVAKPTAEAVKAEIAKAVAAGKPAPKPEVVEKQLAVAKVAAPKKAETRAKAKKEGKVAKKAVKKKTTGKGKAIKRGAKVKKAAKKVKAIVKKAKKKAEKKKKAAKKAAKKPAKKAAKKRAKKEELRSAPVGGATIKRPL